MGTHESIHQDPPYKSYNWIITIYCCRILGLLDRSWGLDLVASLSQRGVKGEIRFSGDDDGRVVVTADLNVAQGAEGEYTWGIYEFPIDYTKVRFYLLIIPSF